MQIKARQDLIVWMISMEYPSTGCLTTLFDLCCMAKLHKIFVHCNQTRDILVPKLFFLVFEINRIFLMFGGMPCILASLNWNTSTTCSTFNSLQVVGKRNFQQITHAARKWLIAVINCATSCKFFDILQLRVQCNNWTSLNSQCNKLTRNA